MPNSLNIWLRHLITESVVIFGHAKEEKTWVHVYHCQQVLILWCERKRSFKVNAESFYWLLLWPGGLFLQVWFPSSINRTSCPHSFIIFCRDFRFLTKWANLVIPEWQRFSWISCNLSLLIFLSLSVLSMKLSVYCYTSEIKISPDSQIYWLNKYTHSPAKQVKTNGKKIQQAYIWLKEANTNRMLTRQ